MSGQCVFCLGSQLSDLLRRGWVVCALAWFVGTALPKFVDFSKVQCIEMRSSFLLDSRPKIIVPFPAT